MLAQRLHNNASTAAAGAGVFADSLSGVEYTRARRGRRWATLLEFLVVAANLTDKLRERLIDVDTRLG